MPSKNKQPEIPLPKSWGTHVKSAILHVIALGQDPSSGQGSIPVKKNRRNSVCLSCLFRRLSEAPDDLMAWRNIMTGKSTPVCVAVALGLMACGPARPASARQWPRCP